MQTENPPLPLGYSSIAPGQIATVVTFLQMLARPEPRPVRDASPTLVLEHWPSPSIQDYRPIFRAVGEHWMWDSRLTMDDGTLAAILANPATEVHVLRDGERLIGLMELDFQKPHECELVFFGLVPEAIGRGAGRFLMNQAVALAWSRDISRFWVHTCHLDSPAALPFYRRSGFEPCAFMVEVVNDPRLAGIVPLTASPHVPLLRP